MEKSMLEDGLRREGLFEPNFVGFEGETGLDNENGMSLK